MRFDLEYTNIGNLTEYGLDALAEIFYGENGEATPMLWDTKFAIESQNKGSVNTKAFSNFSREVDSYFVSGLAKESTLSLDSIFKKDGTMTLMFNGGSIISNRRLIEWSNDRVIKVVDFIHDAGYYKVKIDTDIDLDTISIFTLTKLNNKNFQTKKEYSFVEYDGFSVASTFENAIKTKDHLYTIENNYIFLNSKEMVYTLKDLGTYRSGNAIFSLPEFPAKNLKIEDFDNTQFIELSGTIFFKNYLLNKISKGDHVIVSYNVAPFVSYKQKGRAEKGSDIVFKNMNVSPRSINFKNGIFGIYTSYGADIQPISLDFFGGLPSQIGYKDTVKVTAILKGVDDIPILKHSEDGDGVTLKIVSNNAVWKETQTSEFYSGTGIDGTVSATLGINPEAIGTYIQKEWVENIGAEGIITLPYKLQMLGSGDRAYTSNDFKKVFLYVIYNDDPLVGKISALTGEQPIVEYYTYKDNNTIESNMGVQEETFKSYYVSGRKVAFVTTAQMSNNASEITSIFIKPISITTSNISVDSFFRELFIKSKNISTRVRGTDGKIYKCKRWHTSSNINKPTTGKSWAVNWVLDSAFGPVMNWEEGKTYLPVDQFTGIASSQMLKKTLVSSDALAVKSGRYISGILPGDKLNIYKTPSTSTTKIKYDTMLPTDDPLVIGYWLVTDREIEIQAVYNDKYIKLESDIKKINMQSLQSETSFTISGSKTPGANTSIGEFGYLSISDYFKSQFGLNYLSYLCINSDCINKKCIHQNESYRTNFILNKGNIACIRTESYETNHPEIGKCPGLDVRLVAPFGMTTTVS